MLPHRTNSICNFAVMKTALLSAAVLAAAIALDATKARADDLIVVYDQSQLLRLPRPATEIIIGNPSIADVTVQGGNLLVVTGKTFGMTNIIAMDAEHNVIQDQRVIVQRDDRKMVNLTKAGQRQTFTCTPNCSPTLTIGDDTQYFDMVSKHNSTKTKFSDSGGDAASQQGAQ